MFQIIPAILASSEDQYSEDLAKIRSCSQLQSGWLHIDFADGEFVKSTTVAADTIRKFPTFLKREAHLMVANPNDLIEELIKIGFERIIIHAEVDEEKITDSLFKINQHKKHILLALNPDTEIEKIKKFEPEIDGILLMSVIPGAQGQQFIESTLEKITKAREAIGQKVISVDGGINDSNVKLIKEHGADSAVVGSYLLKGDINENLEKINKALG